MIKAIISDFSKVLLFALDNSYQGKLNDLHATLLAAGDYDPWHYFRLNQELLDFYQQQSSTHDIYIFTTEYIQDYPPIKAKLGSIFKKILIGTDLGLGKDSAETYQKIAKIVGLAPSEIIFIDDIKRHVIAAQSVGLNALHFQDTKLVIAQLQAMLK